MIEKKGFIGALLTLTLVSCGGVDNSANVVTGDGYPNPNPVIKEPRARFSYFFSKIAFSNISKAV